jgi:very-long-chain (3R)-3-hydroxyacyl-CoA dehydratase
MITTFTQVFSRLFLVWGVVDLFPNSVRGSPAYPVMLLSWSITEVIRYSFYAWNLLDDVPYFLLWLRYPFDVLVNGRYTTFWVLYPIGVGAEMWLTGSALKEAYAWNPLYAYYMVAVMVGYIPGMLLSVRI